MKRLRRVPGAVPERLLHGTSAGRAAVQADLLLAARDAIAFAASGYGPDAGHKLIDDEGPLLLTSAASALREIRIADPIARPYKSLATAVQAAVGEGGASAVLLAARLVEAALEARDRGVRIGASIDGYGLARRQALAQLAVLARPDPDAASLGPDGPTLLRGLESMAGPDGAIDLDAVDVRCEPGPVEWAEGLVIEPKHAPDARRIPDAGVLLVQQGPSRRPASDAGIRIRHPGALDAFRDHEARLRNQELDHLLGLGVRLLVGAKDLDDEMAHRLAAAGVLVVTDAPKHLLRRLATATGAVLLPEPSEADAKHLGRADLVRRPLRRGGWVLHGPGPSATLSLPSRVPALDAATIDGAERGLRAAGAFLDDSRAVPGDGAWQRALASALRKAAPHADGKAALGVEAAAKAFDALADDLVRARGGDPLDPAAPADVVDPYPCIRHAVDAAFEVAIGVLRLDGRYAKRASSPDALRGGGGPAGSPKGLPGDVPPLM